MDNEKLTLWQVGRKTLVSVTEEGFIEGLVDGAFVISGLHGIENPIEIPVTYDLAGYRARSLRYLVMSSGDSFLFRRAGDTIVNWLEPDLDTPWRMSVGDLIAEYFQPELRQYMPQGVWHLGITAS